MNSNEQILFRRSRILFVLLFLWLAATAFRALQIGGFDRERHLKLGESFARSEGLIPAARGRLLDRDGVALAWSERYYDLCADLSPGETLAAAERGELRRRFPGIDFTGPVLQRSLSPDEVLALEGVINGGVRVRIAPRIERIMVNSATVRRRIGQFEERHDAELRGRPGRYRVLLDHYRRWIPSSWELLTEPVPGRDVKLTQSLAELEQEGGR